jgi:hypothetical protein
MRKHIIPALLFLLMVSGGRAYAQENEEKAVLPRDRFLRFNFLGLLDPFDNNLTVGMEQPLSNHFSVALDAGWIFYSNYFSNAKSSNGILLRPSIRWYPRVEGRGFLETELHYKMVSYRLEDWIGRDCDNEVPAFDEYTTFSYRKRSYGFNLRGGVKSALDREKKFWLEFSGGLGIRWRNQGLHNEPNSCYNRVGTFFNPNGSNVISGMPLTIRALYRL